MDKSRSRKHNKLENKIRDYIAISGGGVTEVSTPVGKIDVIFHSRKIVVEIKYIPNWKSAIGQLICYQNSCEYLVNYQKHLLLFGRPNLTPYLFGEVSKRVYPQMQKICQQSSISLEFFPKQTLIDLAYSRKMLSF